VLQQCFSDCLRGILELPNPSDQLLNTDNCPNGAGEGGRSTSLKSLLLVFEIEVQIKREERPAKASM
jgi:hypothetical protein